MLKLIGAMKMIFKDTGYSMWTCTHDTCGSCILNGSDDKKNKHKGCAW